MLIDISNLFGKDVADIVSACSDTLMEPKPPWPDRKQAYIAHLAGQPGPVLRVALADKLFNARAILRDYLEVGERIWERFRLGREGQLWYYRQLADSFARLRPGPMARELAEIVDELEQVTGPR